MELTVNAPLVGLAVTVALNFGAIVWAASKFKSELGHLASALDRLSAVLEQTSARVHNHEVRLSVLENRGGRRMDDPEP